MLDIQLKSMKKKIENKKCQTFLSKENRFKEQKEDERESYNPKLKWVKDTFNLKYMKLDQK